MSALAASAQQTKAEQQQAEWTLLKKMVRDHPNPNPNPSPNPSPSPSPSPNPKP